MTSIPRPPVKPKPYMVKFGLRLEEQTLRVLKKLASDDGFRSCSAFVEKLVLQEQARRLAAEGDSNG